MKVFISHIAEEKDLAVILKSRITTDFLGRVECYVSSDTESVLAGENWLTSIGQALSDASVEMILCSSLSVKRPWINFEAGAGWIRGIPIVPVCHSGMTPRTLPMPLTVLQAITASEPNDLRGLYATIANAHKSLIPEAPFEDLAGQVRAFEAKYDERKGPGGPTANASKDRMAIDRMLEGLKHSSHRFRSIEQLSIAAGVSEGEAMDLLRQEPDVVFAKGKSGRLIARLKSR
jgi:hypothetical protein